MSSWLNQTRLVQEIAENLLAPKKTRYQQDLIRYSALKSKRIECHSHTVINQYQQKLKSTVFLPENDQNCCIIYLHGYGSHRMEGVSILQAIPKQFGFCCFDFSGSGKSEGQLSSYGLKQSQDIAPIVQMLKNKYQFKKFILWGRSMGAVASVLYTSNQEDGDIIFQVLDSPFSSFQSISIHHAKNIIKLPELFINFGISIMKQNLKEHQFNPYTINMCQQIKKCHIPTLFVYCEQDNVIPSNNSRLIIQKYPANALYEQIIISEDHNTYRSKQTLANIIEVVKKYTFHEKIKEKVKHRKGFNQIISSTIPTSRTKGSLNIKKFSGFIQCSLSKHKKIPHSAEEKNSPNHLTFGGISSFSSPSLKH